MKQNKFFLEAKKYFELSTHRKARMGAVIVHGNKIISTGFNKEKTHPLQQHYNKFRNFKGYHHDHLHAEIDAIVSTPRLVEKKNLQIFIYRENKRGGLALCRPCAGCMKALKDYGINKIHYTTNHGYATEEFE